MTGGKLSEGDLGEALAAAEQAREDARAELLALEAERREDRRQAQHHLRNLLSVVRAMARRSAEDADDVEGYCAALDGRLAAYLHVQATLAEDLRRGLDLGSLVADELLRFGIREGEGASLDGPPTRLGPAAAGLMALALHELASDYVVSGRADEAAAPLRVQWRSAPAGMMQIEWIEATTGGRAPPDAPSAWVEWIDRAIAYQVGGTVAESATAGSWGRTFTLPHPQ